MLASPCVWCQLKLHSSSRSCRRPCGLHPRVCNEKKKMYEPRTSLYCRSKFVKSTSSFVSSNYERYKRLCVHQLVLAVFRMASSHGLTPRRWKSYEATLPRMSLYFCSKFDKSTFSFVSSNIVNGKCRKSALASTRADCGMRGIDPWKSASHIAGSFQVGISVIFVEKSAVKTRQTNF